MYTNYGNDVRRSWRPVDKSFKALIGAFPKMDPSKQMEICIQIVFRLAKFGCKFLFFSTRKILNQ